MENASKALIIAGAILLSIAIIGIGMSVFNGAQDAVNQANMDEATITTFNAKFSSYEGTNVKGSRVNNLLSTIAQNNLANQNDESKIVQVKIVKKAGVDGDIELSETGKTLDTMYGGTKEGKSITKKLPSGYVYDVVLTADSSGLYTKVEITRK